MFSTPPIFVWWDMTFHVTTLLASWRHRLGTISMPCHISICQGVGCHPGEGARPTATIAVLNARENCTKATRISAIIDVWSSICYVSNTNPLMSMFTYDVYVWLAFCILIWCDNWIDGLSWIRMRNYPSFCNISCSYHVWRPFDTHV
jgi:hypothetical protein